MQDRWECLLSILEAQKQRVNCQLSYSKFISENPFNVFKYLFFLLKELNFFFQFLVSGIDINKMVPSTKTETYVTVSTDEEGNTVKRVITRTILSEKVFLFVVLKFDLNRLTIVKCK